MDKFEKIERIFVEIHTLLQEVMSLYLHTFKSQSISRQLSQKERTGGVRYSYINWSNVTIGQALEMQFSDTVSKCFL